ncbi:MAG: alpha/beta fold hydrolase [Kangiellaceae bacterium]
MTKQFTAASVLVVTLLFSALVVKAKPMVEEVSFESKDKVSVNGYWIKSDKPKSSPTIVLFHQAGASAQGEYKTIYPRLVDSGFNVLMIDLRSGGNRFGGTNKTAAKMGGKKIGYCEAYPDMNASLDWLNAQTLTGPVIVWGSSYSAGLVFNLAEENKKEVDGVMGFSPASGKPMEACKLDGIINKITVPAIAFRPESEMAYDSVKTQAKLFKSANIPYIEIKKGVHGSSMLVEERTKQNMDHAWEQVYKFLNQFREKDIKQ